MTNREEIERRRTFAIISHPDAGKTTLTEKLLLYGGAINQAGSVKGKQSAKHAVSDWMDIEKQRGISVTSSVLQFNYAGKCVNILDTPGHQDFSEDTYRTLMAADSAVMVIDAAKGVEAQTIKLFKVCTLRHIPIFTFINKMDREARDPFELMENIEEILGIKTYPMNWPIGCGKEFKGVFDRNTRKVLAFSSDGRANGVKKVEETEAELGDAALDELLTPYLHQQLVDEIELLDGAAEEFDLARIDQGQKAAAHTPVDLSKLVSDATLPFEALFFEQELTLETDIAPDLTVPGDAAQLRQVVEILLDNAQKYAEAPGTVRVTLARQGHHVRLCVADTGAPLSPEDCKNIFKRFYRLDDARSRDGSFGLGLAIAQSIVDTHHGRIWCESATGLNSFFVELPQ